MKFNENEKIELALSAVCSVAVFIFIYFCLLELADIAVSIGKYGKD